MTVIVVLDTGDKYALDRGLWAEKVADEINNKRGTGKLIPFQNNSTPSRTIYIDPDHVVTVKSDGYGF